MDIQQVFEYWRAFQLNDRGLTWFLANEFCKRYYASHGIAPYVIDHEGLGYYGIVLARVRCPINAGLQAELPGGEYGRMTMAGNVENWRNGEPGDHGLKTQDFCKEGMPAEELVRRAVAHMDIEPIPRVSHYNCRHKRWGASFTLCFEVCAILALMWNGYGLEIWNHPYHTERLIAERDPNAKQKEHLGAFLIRESGKELLLAADGRLLDRSNRNLWQMYMTGWSPFALARLLKETLERMPKPQ